LLEADINDLIDGIIRGKVSLIMRRRNMGRKIFDERLQIPAYAYLGTVAHCHSLRNPITRVTIQNPGTVLEHSIIPTHRATTSLRTPTISGILVEYEPRLHRLQVAQILRRTHRW
jgi:hypothetical protein